MMVRGVKKSSFCGPLDLVFVYRFIKERKQITFLLLNTYGLSTKELLSFPNNT